MQVWKGRAGYMPAGIVVEKWRVLTILHNLKVINIDIMPQIRIPTYWQFVYSSHKLCQIEEYSTQNLKSQLITAVAQGECS